MADRRYSDEEVRRIIALAAEAEQAAALEPDRPWTLGDVERIGTEAGLAPQAVTAAAIALERQTPIPSEGSLFGLPVTVSRAVPLSRNLSDDEWDRLVRQLRETFAARGRVQVSGARREWRVGNLRVTHEPAGSGALLELRTRKGDARAFLQVGAVLLLTALFMSTIANLLAPTANETRRLIVASFMGLMGAMMLIVGVLRLPAWARRRAQQFEALANYARSL